jgi:hypothetical protein
LEQVKVIADHVPRFAQINPFAENPLAAVTLPYPFWLKPVRSVLSHLGFRINNATEFHNSIARIRQGIARYAEPFNYLLHFAKLPEHVAAVDGYHCIAEAMIASRHQCTFEGYVYTGDVQVYGAIDSLREGPNESCFSCYRYPSALPQPVQQRMVEITKRVLIHIGYDNAPFNVEFFWDEEADRIWLLEINTRISKSHCPLFYLVDGEYHHQVMIDIALGNRPAFPHRQGRFTCAAKFMLRRYEDALVTRVPTPEEINRITTLWPDVIVQIPVQEGMHLSQLHDQDSYSYEIAVLFMGADDHQSLLEKYRQCRDMLPLEFSPNRH